MNCETDVDVERNVWNTSYSQIPKRAQANQLHLQIHYLHGWVRGAHWNTPNIQITFILVKQRNVYNNMFIMNKTISYKETWSSRPLRETTTRIPRQTIGKNEMQTAQFFNKYIIVINQSINKLLTILGRYMLDQNRISCLLYQKIDYLAW